MKVVRVPSADGDPCGATPSDMLGSVQMALMRAVRPAGTVISAVYLLLIPGVSWHGTMDLAWMAWH